MKQSLHQVCFKSVYCFSKYLEGGRILSITEFFNDNAHLQLIMSNLVDKNRKAKTGIGAFNK